MTTKDAYRTLPIGVAYVEQQEAEGSGMSDGWKYVSGGSDLDRLSVCK